MSTLTSLLLALLSLPAFSAVKLPTLISDNMVLQQRMPVRIWGTASPGEKITVSFNGQTTSSTTEGDNRWEVFLNPMIAGGPFEMTIAGTNTISLKNVLIGEVWVASGQSNMAWTVKQTNNAEKEIAAANYPQIRFFRVRTTVAEKPLDDVKDGAWKACNPDNVPDFSGVAYFFARDLLTSRGVPIGIIQSAVGGTPAQAWTSQQTLHDDLNLHWYLDRWNNWAKDYPAAKTKHEAALAAYKKEAAKASAEGKPAPRAPAAPMGAPAHPHTPSGLYNGMIAPLTDYAIRGAIWYQGEANGGDTDNELYRRLFSEMILDWRKAWGIGQFPFLWVQLASFNPPNAQWPIVRDSQTATLALSNTAQALAIDIGEPNDIHPKNKQTVGARLALAARAVAYHERITYSGPMMSATTRDRGSVRVWFEHLGSGLDTRNSDKLTGFRVAGSDGRYFKADARIDGNTVVVSSSLVRDPIEVRYAWENDPAANLINKEGLPAVPFRTDNWK